MSFAGAHPAALRQHHRHRLRRNQRRRRRAPSRLRAPRSASGGGRRIRRHLFPARRAPACAAALSIRGFSRGRARSAWSLACSPRISISCSLLRNRSFSSRIASACSSDSLKRAISTGFGSSSRRMMRITSSMLRYAIEVAVEDVDARVDVIVAMLQPPAHRLDAELQPLAQQVLERVKPRPAVEADHVHVHAVRALQIGRGEEVRHHLVEIDAVRARHEHDARRVLVIRLVAHVLDHRQLLRVHLRRDLLLHLVAGDHERQRGDDDVAVLDLPLRALADRAVAGLVHLPNLRARRDDLRLGRKIRTFDVLRELRDRGVGIVEQLQARADDFADVVRRDVGGHADRDPRRAVEQHVRQSRRQQLRLAQRAVEVLAPVDGALLQLRQQRLRELRQLRLGVAHRGELFRIVGRAEVALPFHERIAHRERLRHQHHGVVAGRVAVRMKLADDVADRARRLLRLRVRTEPQLRHRVDDAALHGLESVGDMRQRAVEDDVHRIVEVRLPREVGHSLMFDLGDGGRRRCEGSLFFRFAGSHQVLTRGRFKTRIRYCM